MSQHASTGLHEADVREALVALDPLWDTLFPAEQARIVQLLVERIDLRDGVVEIRLRADGLTRIACEMAQGTLDPRAAA